MPNTFDWVEIRVRDVEKTAQFYETLFGWRITRKETAEGSDYWIFDTGGKPRMENIKRGGMWLRPEGESVGVVVYIVVDNIESVLDKVTEQGGRIVTPKTPHGSAFHAYFTDPSGNIFGLREEKRVG